MDAKQKRSLERINEEIVTYSALAEGLALMPDDMSQKVHLPLVKYIVAQHSKTVEHVEKGLPLVANTFTNPPEIFSAMDIHWFFIFQAAWGGGVENPHLMEDLEIVDNMAVASDCCTLLRMGLYYIDQGYLPVPTAYVGIVEPCDGVTSVHEAIMSHKDWRNVPSFAPEPTYYTDERSIKYYAGEIKRMAEFLEKHTGNGLSIDRLRNVIEETNKQYALWHEYNALRMSSPTPHDAILPQSCFYVTNFAGAGDPCHTVWFQDLIAEAERRIAENDPVVPNQKFRVLWFDIPSVYYATLVPWMEQELGGTVVLDMISYCPYTQIDTSTEDTMFEGLAKRSLNDGPMIRQAKGFADNFLADIETIVNDFKIDCVIWPGHMGHKDGAASISLMREKCREINVPFLTIGLDHVDRRYTSLEEIQAKISQFVKAMVL